MNSDEKVLLSIPQDSLKCAGWGSLKPVPTGYILTAPEIEVVENTVNDYNLRLGVLIAGKDIAFVDLNKKLKSAATGEVKFEGVELTNEFVTGNLFSLDGLHLTPVGSAAVAYFFIEEINYKFNAAIPQVIVSEFPAVTYPDAATD
jgi:hypothetical protein